MLDFLVVIPARYKSSRFEGKPLALIDGMPMLVRTYKQCLKAIEKEKIFVATDNSKIKDLCDQFEIQSILTSENCLTGTDRVAEVAENLKAQFYINIQGDEPLINPEDIKLFLQEVKKTPEKLHNGFCNAEESHFYDYNSPKIVVNNNNELLYISRAPIPGNKKNTFISCFRQVCIYSYPYKALKDFASSKSKTKLETIEDIEILRFLELGWKINMIQLSESSISVDKPSDIIRVENEIAKRTKYK